MSQSDKYDNLLELNQEAYQRLLKVTDDNTTVHELIDGPNWYQLTYDLFRSSPLDSFEDFLRIIAYTYSWMPTIPTVKVNYILDKEELLERLRSLRKGDFYLLPDLLKQLIPVINNSLVGVSKVLHFIASDHVPIIDRNVLSGWTFFFSSEYPNLSVPKMPHYKTALNQKHIPQYLEYRTVLNKWAVNCDTSVSMRELESALFYLGRTVTLDKFKVYQPAL
ncbi:hypothetical protein [Flavihumibacter sp. ZG627]|uniref:hypothetical protein n=1 Tax=Flavihumibacter sp. ZG627 TaxID=1463156 RepID=UPI0006935F11|nr:hypothetical protein [Flavihumibacter sp. ZG627]